jgi:hypothetical protein
VERHGDHTPDQSVHSHLDGNFTNCLHGTRKFSHPTLGAMFDAVE